MNMKIDIEEKSRNMKNRKRNEAEVRERQQRHQHQQQQNEQEESDNEHSIFNQVRTMMDEIKRDRAIITDIANQVTIERTVISNLADKMKK